MWTMPHGATKQLEWWWFGQRLWTLGDFMRSMTNGNSGEWLFLRSQGFEILIDRVN